MSFIHLFPFKARLTKPALMNFIARVPVDHYFMAIVDGGAQVYGIFLEESSVEFLLNEFDVLNFEFVPMDQVKKSLTNPGVKQAGNQALLDI